MSHDRTLKVFAERYVCHELEQLGDLVGSSGGSAGSTTADPDGLEAFLVHLRQLDGFLRSSVGSEPPDGLCACHYLADWAGSGLADAEWAAVRLPLTHLVIDPERDARAVKVTAAKTIVCTFDQFLTGLRRSEHPERVDWFDRGIQAARRALPRNTGGYVTSTAPRSATLTLP